MQAWDDYRRLSSGDGPFDLPDWSVIELSGEDWREWLQGQITGDVRQLSDTNPVGFCLTKPTGQILSYGELSLRDSEGWLSVPTSSVDAILHRVATMVILEDCNAKVLDVPVAWSPSGLLPGVRGEATSPEGWRLFLLDRESPNWLYDFKEKTLPPELGEAFIREHVSYTKGCYTGQEVLQRIHSRGHTNRTWRVYQHDAELLEKEGFTQTNQAEHPDGYWLVGGYQRNESAEPGDSQP